MNKIKGIIAVVKLVLKYAIVVMAVVKGVTVMVEELEKIDSDDSEKQTVKALANE